MVGTARCLHSFMGRSGTGSLWVPRGVSSRAEPSNPSDSPSPTAGTLTGFSGSPAAPPPLYHLCSLR